jgi:[CysO sulfur-carrier protein]-S-L-cysteine hydrolase
VVIDRAAADALIAQARRDAPNETCGMLALADGAVVRTYPMENVEASPVFFKLHPVQQLNATEDMEDNGWQIGIYHSHTHSPARPSETDKHHANSFALFYTDTLHVIVSLADPEVPDIRAFRIDGDTVSEESVEIV